MTFNHWYFYITYIYIYFNKYWFLLSDMFILFTPILTSSCIYFYTLTFLSNLHLYLFHLYWFLHIDIFILVTIIIISACIDFNTSTFLYYLHLYLLDHVMVFTHWRFYVTYTYFIMYWFLHIEASLLLTLIHISECIDFFTLTFLYYLLLFICQHVLIFTHWHFYVTYTYIMFWFLHIDILGFLRLYLFYCVLTSTHRRFYVT